MEAKPNTSRSRQKPEIDWAGIHRRMDEMQVTLASKSVRSREEKRAILKLRAQQLARETGDEIDQQDMMEVITFRLATETYGIETSYVREAFPLKDFTTLPGLPPFVLGVLNVRGQIVSVLNIKKFFDLPETGIGELNKMIIIHNDDMEFGILADEIPGIRNVSLGALQKSLPTLSGIREKYFKGVTDDQLIILNAENLLTDKNIIVNEEVAL